MNRVVAVVVTLLVVAGSVPAAATLVDGTQADGTEGGAEPGAGFAGVVGVQQAEVDNEVSERSLAQRFERATSNDSKARVVAEEQAQLEERLDELESQKARLERARENGSIGQGEYRARLAGLAAEIRGVERQANRTAGVADTVPDEALRDNGANASAVREVAQRANRTGGGEVAAAARSVAGEGVGNGLRGPPNASERGPPNGTGPPDVAGGGRNGSDSPGADTAANASDRPSDARGTGNGSNGSAPDDANASDQRPGADGDRGVTNQSANGTGPGPISTTTPGDAGDGADSDSTGGGADGDGGNGADDKDPGDGTDTETPAA